MFPSGRHSHDQREDVGGAGNVISLRQSHGIDDHAERCGQPDSDRSMDGERKARQAQGGTPMAVPRMRRRTRSSVPDLELAMT